MIVIHLEPRQTAGLRLLATALTIEIGQMSRSDDFDHSFIHSVVCLIGDQLHESDRPVYNARVVGFIVNYYHRRGLTGCHLLSGLQGPSAAGFADKALLHGHWVAAGSW